MAFWYVQQTKKRLGQQNDTNRLFFWRNLYTKIVSEIMFGWCLIYVWLYILWSLDDFIPCRLVNIETFAPAMLSQRLTSRQRPCSFNMSGLTWTGLTCALLFLHCVVLPTAIQLVLSTEGEELPYLKHFRSIQTSEKSLNASGNK